MKKERLDVLLVERRLVESRSQAQRMIMAGDVRVDGQMIIKPSHEVQADCQVEIKQSPPYVSRGGEKLEAALIAFESTDLSGCICADVGSSTGGFTDCLLKHGAAKVYAIDVGKGELHWKLRNDPRVVVMEKTNARYVSALDERIDLVTIDASFISLKTLLPVVVNWLKNEGTIIALIKPQFEAGRQETAKGGGVIREANVHRRVLAEILEFAPSIGLFASGLIQSPLLGPKGNREFLVELKRGRGEEEKNSAMIDAIFQHDDEGNF